MDDQTITAIRAYFAKLGLADTIADIYLSLHSHGPQTLSSLARTSGVERTRIYRLLDELIHANLIESETQYARGLIKAAPIANLHILINQKEQEVAALKEELGLIEQVLGRNQLTSPTTRVQAYHGPEGIRQILWNQLQSTTPIYGYSSRILDEYTGRPFMQHWVEEYEHHKLKKFVLINDTFVSDWLGFKLGGHHIRGMEYNYLPPDIFPITHTCDIYNDVTAYLTWHGSEVFGLEIYNRQMADAQRILLRGLWQQSKPETRL